MAMKLYSDASVQAIANAIRTKNGASTQYKIADMAPAILAIPTGGGSAVGGINVVQDEGGYVVVPMNGGGQPKIAVTGTTPTQELVPNVFYIFGECTSLTVTFATPTNTDVINEYHFRFTSGATATTLSLPQSVTMANGFSVAANKTYELSIIDNLGTYIEW